MNERDFADLAVGHALHALTEADERAYQEALAGNPHWDHHVREAADTATAISSAIEPVEPPPSVRAALFARISDLPQEPAASNASSAAADQGRDDEDYAAAGTAPVAPTQNLVVTGLYRHVRNPIYLAVVAIILGQAVLLGDGRLVVYGALLWLGFHAFVVAYEEPTLEETFGSEYEACRAAVPRWMPRMRPWRAV